MMSKAKLNELDEATGGEAKCGEAPARS